jgi:hypothetical protein
MSFDCLGSRRIEEGFFSLKRRQSSTDHLHRLITGNAEDQPVMSKEEFWAEIEALEVPDFELPAFGDDTFDLGDLDKHQAPQACQEAPGAGAPLDEANRRITRLEMTVAALTERLDALTRVPDDLSQRVACEASGQIAVINERVNKQEAQIDGMARGPSTPSRTPVPSSTTAAPSSSPGASTESDEDDEDAGSEATSACDWSDLSLTEEWEYGSLYGFDDTESGGDDDGDAEDDDAVDADMDDLVRRMIDFVFDM